MSERRPGDAPALPTPPDRVAPDIERPATKHLQVAIQGPVNGSLDPWAMVAVPVGQPLKFGDIILDKPIPPGGIVAVSKGYGHGQRTE